MRYWTPIALLMLFCAPLLMAQKSVDVDEYSEAGESLTISAAVNYTTDGVKALNLFNDAKRAKALLYKAIESDPDYAPAHHVLAGMNTPANADSAFYHAERAYLSDTTNKWYLANYAQSAAIKDQIPLAQSLFEKLIKIYPTYINAYRVLALLHNERNQPMEAVRVLDSAVVKVGENPYLEGLKRQILLSNNQFDRVIGDAKQKVEEEPFSIERKLALAEIYRDLKLDSLAFEEYKSTLAMDSMRIETLISMGNFLKSHQDMARYIRIMGNVMQSDQITMEDKIALVGELTNDKKTYEKEYIAIGGLITSLIIQYPNNEQLINMQASHLIACNMLDEALTMLKGHLDMEPPSLPIYRMVIDIERYKNQMDSVEYYIGRAIERFPENQDLRMEWGYTLTTQNRFDEAIELYSSHLDGATDSISSSIWGIIGDVHHQAAISNADDPKLFKRRMKSTYRAYDKALEYSDQNAMALNNYAYFLCEYDANYKRALPLSKRAIEIEASNPTYIDTYAWILYKIGEFEEAKVQMRRAISLDTTQNAEVALHYAQILAALGEMTMANHYWSKALEWGMSKESVEQSRAEAEQLGTHKQKPKKE